MHSENAMQHLSILLAPWWKLWIGKARRGEAADALVALGAEAVPDLIEHYCERDLDSSLEKILVRIGEPAVAPLCELGVKKSDPQQMMRFAGIFEEMGPAAASAIPVLLRWAGYQEDPRLAVARHLTGDEDLDPRIAAAIDVPPPSYLETSIMAWVRQEAAGALRNMGPALVPYLPVLRKLETRSDLDDEYQIFSGRIRTAIDQAEEAAAESPDSD